MKTFQGRPVLAGQVKGQSVVSRQGVNLLASFQKSALRKAKTVICSDQNNRDLFGKVLTGKILCLPQTIGSTTGGLVLEAAADLGLQPLALLFSGHIDSLAAAGVILSDRWVNKRIVTVDNLGKEFLDYVQDGRTVEIQEDGTVSVE
jgi:predicted aconitase with swiveling domain